MPNSPITHASIRQLTLTYVSMFCILFILLTTGQILVQLVFAHGAHVRTVAEQITAQEERTQRMFYDVIQLQSPGTAPGTTYASLTRDIERDDVSWEQIQDAMYTGNPVVGIAPSDFSSGAQAILAKAKPDYTGMRAALHRIFAAENAHPPATPTQVRPDINIYYLDEAPYLASLISVNGDLIAQADDYAQGVRVSDFILFVLSALIVLPAEAFFVARPALTQLQGHLRLIDAAMQRDTQKEAQP